MTVLLLPAVPLLQIYDPSAAGVSTWRAGPLLNGEVLIFGEYTAKMYGFTKKGPLDLLHVYNSCWKICH